MRLEFRYNPRAAWLPGAAWAGSMIAFLAGAALQTGFAQIMLACMAFLGAIGLFGVMPLIFDRRVQLAIGPDGLFYRPFSPQTVPWNEIKAVAIVQTHWPLGSLLRIVWRSHLRQDSINFDVGAEDRMKHGSPFYRVAARMTNAPPCPLYPVILSHLEQADAASVVRAIKLHWKGQVPEFEVGKPR